MMHSKNWVLGISKRPAVLCAAQSELFAAGIELFTVADMTAARAAIQASRVRAVIVCKHSWTESEREQAVAELAESRSDLIFIMRCPGCEESNEAQGLAGYLADESILNQLIAAIAPASVGQ